MDKLAIENLITEACSYFNLEYSASPLQKLILNNNLIYLKRDDLLPLKCTKQRSIIPLIYHYLKSGYSKFVVSGSGNSGIVSSFCALRSPEIKEMQVLLYIGISDTKLSTLIDRLELDTTPNELRENGYSESNLDIKIVKDPRQEAFSLGKNGYINLRGSTDDYALLGFETISYEIGSEFNTSTEIYIPASSGTTALGIFNGFLKTNNLPKFNIIQTTKANALVKNFFNEIQIEVNHPSEAIVDIIGHRRSQIESIIKESSGKAFIINIQEVKAAYSQLTKAGINTSFDSALTLAAYIKNPVKSGKHILICTG